MKPSEGYPTSMKCDYCEIVDEKRDVLYEDGQVIIAVKDTGFALGQITVFPREHFTILEQVPDEILQQCARLANTAGVAVFEGLEVKGTNILVQNGLAAGQKVPHFSIEVIPRSDSDTVQLSWQPTQQGEDELQITFMQFQEELDALRKPKAEKRAPESKEQLSEKKNEQNYLLRSLRRMP